jgi:outer membrane protein assembly factor BamB
MKTSCIKAFCALLAALPAACAAPHDRAQAVSAATLAPSAPHERIAWTTYQHSPDRNAVFNRPGFAPIWAYDTKAKINSGLALAGDNIVLDTFDKEVIALDARSGHPRWRSHVPNIVMSTPVIANGTVYVGTGKNGTLNRDSNPALRVKYAGKDVWGIPAGDDIIAMDLKNGTKRWSYHTDGEDMPTPVYYQGTIIFANGDWHAYALQAETGRQLWSTDIGGASTMASAVIAGTAVIVAACADGFKSSSAVALDPSNGKILWKSPYGHCDGSPAYGEGKVFVASVAPGSKKYVGSTVVAALDAQTGKPAWVYRNPSPGVWSILSSDESAIAGTYYDGIYYQPAPLNDELVAFDASSGKIRWRFHTTGPVKMSPVIKDHRLYVGDTVGVLYTLDSRTGGLIEARPFKKPFTTSPPLIVGDTMFIVNGTTVYAMPLSGEIRAAD